MIIQVRTTGEEGYECIIRPSAVVGGWKSILDGGYSGPSSHISLDMNLCLRSTCRSSPFASPSSSPSSFFLPLPPSLRHHHRQFCPPSSQLLSALLYCVLRFLATTTSTESPPGSYIYTYILFSFFGENDTGGVSYLRFEYRIPTYLLFVHVARITATRMTRCCRCHWVSFDR